MAAMIFTAQNFSEATSKGYALIDFWAPWCPSCRRIGPAFDKIAQEYGDQMTIGKLNTDEASELAQKYGVQSIPTLILFRNGEPVSQLVGPDSKAGIENFIRDNVIND